MFTPKVRGYIYGIVAAVVPLLVTLGVLSDNQGGQVLAITSSALTVLASVLAIANIKPADTPAGVAAQVEDIAVGAADAADPAIGQ
jgi:hypothetical protein